MPGVTHGPEKSLLSKRDELRKALLAMDKGWSRHRGNTLIELAKTLEQERFQGGAAQAEYIATWEEIVSIIPIDHPSRFTMLQNLVISLISVNASIPNFHRAIQHLEAALTPMPRDQDRLRTLQLLNSVDSKLRLHCGRIDDLDRVIRTLDGIASLVPPGDSEHAHILCQLGYTYQARYEREHDVADADAAIMYLLKGLSGPLSHLLRPQVTFDVGKGLFQRFELKGNPDDLHQAIEHFESSVDEEGVEACGVYDSLGGALACRHILFGNNVDIDTAVELRRLSLAMMPAGYPATVHCISNLGVSLQQRFGAQVSKDLGDSKDSGDLDEAILCHQQALEYSPPPAFAAIISNRLGCALFDRFDFLDRSNDLTEAIRNLTEAVRIAPGDLPEAGYIRANLATALLNHPQTEGLPSGIEGVEQTGIDLFQKLVSDKTAEPSTRFEASLRWARFEHKRSRFSEALCGYEMAIELLPLLGWNGVAGRSRMESGTRLVWLSCDAASCAIHAGSFERAVEISDHVRSLFWDGISKYRLNTTELKAIRPELANKLWNIGQELEDISFRYQLSGHIVSGATIRSSSTFASEEEAQKFRRLGEDWENCVKEVREVPGYEGFMLPLPFSRLKLAATAGPVVILIAGNFHSDALILHYDKPLQHIPLTKLSGEKAADMVVELHTEALKSSRDDRVLRRILGTLWTTICEPVLSALGATQKTKQRIWWCPTGQLAFLPLHAAGKYNSSANRPIGTQSVPLKTISSYTVTLGRLLASMTIEPTNVCASQTGPRVLLVSNGESVKYDTRFGALPGVAEEVKGIANVVEASEGASLTCFHDQESTVDAVLASLISHDYIHFSCHGTQHWAVPTHSSLLLHDRRLKLVDLLTYKVSSDGSEVCSPTNFQLVFLSACEMATGSGYLPDQAVHLAAGMQSIGFKGVIATLWPIEDAFAPSVSRYFYQELFSQLKKSNSRDAGLALYNALAKARQTDSTNLWGWVPYVHLGV